MIGRTNGKIAGAPEYIMPPTAPAPKAAPAPAPAPPEQPQLGALLSPSQAGTFMGCPARWYFKYQVRMADPIDSNLAEGRAVDAAITANAEQKILTKRDLPVGDVLELFDVAWAEASEETQFEPGEKQDEMAAEGRACIECYMRKAAPAIKPAYVQLPVSGKIGGVDIRGFIDILDVNGMVIDTKTTSRKPTTISSGHLLQLTTYDLLCPQSRGQVRVDYLVKTKTIQFVPLNRLITPADVQYAESVYPMVQDAIREAIYYPKRDNNYLCSRRKCRFWQACEKEFGGEVEP